ncbi:MAG: hypothetical protein L3I99_01400 [Sulfurimonas sp.]|nr:hypothetical protein [Sulfurimonas sp.]
MYLKRYTTASFLLIVIVGWYVYAFVTQDSYAVNLFGVQLPSISIAILITVPLLILYIASLLHMAFYSLLNGLGHRKYDKDYEKFIDSIVDAYLGKQKRSHVYKTDRYKLLGAVIDNSNLMAGVGLKPDTSNEKINKILEIIEELKNGNVVDLKKYSLAYSNQLTIINLRNMYKNGELSAENILNASDKYTKDLLEEVYVDFVKESPFYAIEKYKENLSKEALYIILSRINADENTLEIINDELISLFSQLELDGDDYIAISRAVSLNMIPEQRMKLFESLSENSEEIIGAYLYTLFDLEMLAPADELLNNTSEDEFLNFKSYRALKECGKNFSIDLFV